MSADDDRVGGGVNVGPRLGARFAHFTMVGIDPEFVWVKGERFGKRVRSVESLLGELKDGLCLWGERGCHAS